MVSQVGLNSASVGMPMFRNPYLKDLEEILNNNGKSDTLQFNNNLTADTFSFNGNTTPTNTENTDDLTNYLTEKDTNVATTEAGNRYKKTNKGKIGGAILGTLAPTVTKLLTKGAMKFKPLAIASVAIGLAGAGVGALVDTITNTKRAQAADEAAQAIQTA